MHGTPGIGNRESGIGNRESGIGNGESGIGNRKSGIAGAGRVGETGIGDARRRLLRFPTPHSPCPAFNEY
ncbi:hypothetical protein CAI14_07205 [Xanthomonas citri pv. punicae]|nr:hypothetical protein CAI14_07205 [Xanthomonas citri pv. punicae]QCZ71067.1 hypothetical protein CAI17_04850 [Xanthomonas citri pv. punicae]QCZ83518.1 hypothetical protein XapB_15425 [Xanthomonas citri pv. punicae]